jgi:hypothetical protein
MLTWAKEVFRTVDYLETRSDVDRTRIGYYSLSLGAFFGPIPVALEPRIRASVFAAGGLRFGTQPEIQTANFMPPATCRWTHGGSIARRSTGTIAFSDPSGDPHLRTSGAIAEDRRALSPRLRALPGRFTSPRRVPSDDHAGHPQA